MGNSLAGFHAKWVNDKTSYHEVFWIMQHYLGISWSDLQIKSIEDYNKRDIKDLNLVLEEYQQGKPIAYIIGKTDFYGMTIQVAEGVLIPRVDTEKMVEAIIERLSGEERILELGVGSGAIACAIAKQTSCQVVGIDQSKIACDVAKRNVEELGLSDKVKIIHANWEDFHEFGFDWVVSNPPYIVKGDPDMASSVEKYEPRSALIADQEGYEDLFYIIDNVDRWILPNGRVALEHGFKQQKALEQRVMQKGFRDIYLGKDAKHPRFLIFRYSQ